MYYLLKKTFEYASYVYSTEVSQDGTGDEVKAPDIHPEQGTIGATLWSILSGKIGGDVLTSGVSLPSWLYEPLTIIQRQAEMIEYGDILTAAAACEDPIERIALVAGFAVSGFSSTQRFKPDFNPLLGETYEYIDKRNNTKFFAEQVSHHPPISAFHSANEEGHWIFYQNATPITKFLGNHLDINTQADSYVIFPRTGEQFYFANPRSTRVHNIIMGNGMWIEHFGILDVKNLDGSLLCAITFRQSGFFQGTQYQIDGFIENAKGDRIVKLEGRWDSYLEGTWLKDTLCNKEKTVKKLWTVSTDEKEPKYEFNSYTRTLNDWDEDLKSVLLPTDSRRRLDRYFLEQGDSDTATKWKRTLEERQRADRKNRKVEWQPVWFKKDEKGIWTYNGQYWEQRNTKLEAFKKGEEYSQLLRPAQVIGLACDFCSYEPIAEEGQTDTAPATTTTAPTTTTATTAPTEEKGNVTQE